MEKTIETPKETKETPIKDTNLYNVFTSFKKESVTRLILEEVDAEEGKISYINIHGKREILKTSDEVLLQAPSLNNNFLFAKPVIVLTSFRHDYKYMEENYDEETEEYYDEEIDSSQNVQLLRIFWLATTNGQSFDYLEQGVNNNGTYIDNVVNNAHKGEMRVNAVPQYLVKSFLKDMTIEDYLINNDEDYCNRKKENVMDKTVSVFFDGKRYDGDDIDNIKVNNVLFISNFLHTGYTGRDYVARYKNVSATGYSNHFNYLNDLYTNSIMSTKILFKLKAKPFVKTLKEYVSVDTSYITSRAGVRHSFNLMIKDITIDSEKRKVSIVNSRHLPKEMPHPDCCGAMMPFNHTYSTTPRFEGLSKNALAKIYAFNIANNKADRVIFLTSSQAKPNIEYYKEVFGEKAITFMHDYINMNSGNLIHIYHIDTKYRMMECEPLVITNQKWVTKEDWQYRQAVSDTVNKYLPTIEEMVLKQWFENSEEVVKKTPIKTIKETTNARSRRSSIINVGFGNTPLRNYKIR